MNPPPAISLIVSTYDQPDYLRRLLAAVSRQSCAPRELLLADDGSGEETKQAFSNWASRQSFRCQHLWQAHLGFRKGHMLNQAMAVAQGDYLVFLDGDTLPHPEFIADHAAAARRGCFVQGHRALVEQKAATWFGKNEMSRDRRRAIFQGQLSGLKNAFRWPIAAGKIIGHLRGVRGCNFAAWRDDLVRVNGYDETFTGWGREDSELAARLMNAGIQRLDLRGRAVCFHLWHPPASRVNLPTNDGLLEKTVREKVVRCEQGLDQHL